MKTRIVHLACLLLIFFAVSAKAGENPKPSTKTIMISGVIQDAKSNESLAGVKISCENCSKVIYSDLEGHFFMYLQVSSDQEFKIEFSQVGYAARVLDSKDLGSAAGNLQINLDSE